MTMYAILESRRRELRRKLKGKSVPFFLNAGVVGRVIDYVILFLMFRVVLYV